MLQVKKIPQVNKWNSDESRCEISSLLWANILLAHTRLKFADGEVLEFSPALCDVEKDAAWVSGVLSETDEMINNANLPEADRQVKIQETFEGAIFKIASAEGEGNLRIRIRAFHRNDGAEFGHPGPMSLDAVDLREWVAIYNMLDKKIKELWRVNVRDKEGK